MRKVMLSRRSFHNLAIRAWKIAARHTASSTRVHTSQMRNSSVGYLWLGRASHQILLASGRQLVRIIVSTRPSISAYDWKTGGMPVRGKWRKMIERYDFRPVLRPIQNGELVERQRPCRR